MTLTEEDVATAVHYAANRVFSRYRAFVTREELVSDGLLWIAEHPGRLDNLLAVEDADDPKQVKRAHARLQRTVEKVMAKSARAEKARRSGYDVEDEAYYTLQTVEALLPALWNDEEMAWAPVTEQPEGGSSTDPAEAGNWPVMVLDIRRAFKHASMREDARSALSLRYGSGLTLAQVARCLQVSQPQVSTLIDRGIRALADELSGIRPLNCDPGCECGR